MRFTVRGRPVLDAGGQRASHNSHCSWVSSVVEAIVMAFWMTDERFLYFSLHPERIWGILSAFCYFPNRL